MKNQEILLADNCLVHNSRTKISDMLFSQNDNPEQHLKKPYPEKSNDRTFQRNKKISLGHCSNYAGKPEFS